MKRFIHIKFILCFILVFNSCDTSIKEYKAKNDDEEQIISLLENYLNARNSGDLDGLQSTLHDDLIYVSNDGIKFTKEKLLTMNPEWFVQAGKLKLLNPELSINGNEADLFVKTKHGAHYTTSNPYKLIKSDNKWLIVEHK